MSPTIYLAHAALSQPSTYQVSTSKFSEFLSLSRSLSQMQKQGARQLTITPAGTVFPREIVVFTEYYELFQC